MTGFLNKVFFFITCCTLISTASFAADAPREIAPQISGAGAPMEQDPSQTGYGENPPAAISVTAVGKPSTDDFGNLQEGQGGLNASVWKTSTRESAENLLLQIDSGIADDNIRNLLLRLLMTQAAPPPGKSANDWFSLRVNALINIGQDDKATQMIATLPNSLASQQILQLQTSLELASGNYDKACAKTLPGAHGVEDATAVFWQKLNILCLARAGKQDEAMVGVDVLRETNADDTFFQEYIHKIADKNTPIKSIPNKLSLFDFAMIRLAGDSDKFKDKIDALPPVALKYLAQDTTIDPKLREKASIRAEQLGINPSKEGNKAPEQPFAKSLASDVTTLATALGSGNPANDSDNAVIARLALDDASISDNRRIQKLLSLMEPFGYKIPLSVWQKLTLHKMRFDGEMPPARFVAQINEAAHAGRQAEVILLAALIVDSNETDKIPELALLPVVKALKSVGFEKEARDLAFIAVKRY